MQTSKTANHQPSPDLHRASLPHIHHADATKTHFSHANHNAAAPLLFPLKPVLLEEAAELQYCFTESFQTICTGSEFHVTMTCYAAARCTEFVFDLRRENRPSVVRVAEELCLSDVKDGRLHGTFGRFVTEMFLRKATGEAVHLSFTLSQHAQQRSVFTLALCQRHGARHGALACASFDFFLGLAAAAPDQIAGQESKCGRLGDTSEGIWCQECETSPDECRPLPALVGFICLIVQFTNQLFLLSFISISPFVT